MRAMKDSRIEWIGEIPESWGLIRGKFLFSERNERGNRIQLQLLSPTQKYGVIPQELYDQISGMKAVKLEESVDYAALKSIYEGDFCISLRSFQGGFEYSRFNGVVSPAYHVFFATAELHNAFFRYLFKDRSFIEKMASLTKTFRDGKSIAYSDFADSFIPVPPLPEQSRIAAFLDRRCAEIDRIIEQTRATIEEYKRLKRSIMLEAVTRGLNRNATRIDSGIKWIGDITVGFEVKKLKYLCFILDQFRSPITADQRNQEADVLYDYYGASGAIDKIDGFTIDDHVMLIGEDGANLRMRNLPLMYEVTGKAWINNHAHILKPKEGVDFYYLFYALEALDLNTYITGSAQPKLSQDNMRNIWVPIPVLDEQIKIACFLRDRGAEIDRLIEAKQQLLTQMDSYKKSLIYEYVTGKKEVPVCQ